MLGRKKEWGRTGVVWIGLVYSLGHTQGRTPTHSDPRSHTIQNKKRNDNGNDNDIDRLKTETQKKSPTTLSNRSEANHEKKQSHKKC